MNLIWLIDYWRADYEFSWKNVLFYCCKRIFIRQKMLEVFWRIYLNIIFWILLWMLTSLMIWNLNIIVSATLKYCYRQALNKKLKLMGRTMKYLLKNYWAIKHLGLWSPGLRIFCEKFVKPSGLSPTLLLADVLRTFDICVLKYMSLILQNFFQLLD